MTVQTKTMTLSAAVALSALSLAACAPAPTGNSVGYNQAQTASVVAFGTVTGSRPVTVNANPGGPGAVLGTIAGGVAGAALGAQVGGGAGRDVAMGLGGVAGAAAGNKLAGTAGTTQSTEWFVKTEGGQTISVIQATPVFSAGQRVQIVQGGGQTRLVPAT